MLQVRVTQFAGAISMALALVSCSSFEGYPTDPENSSLLLSSLSTYFDPSWDYKYAVAPSADERKQVRDIIVLNRMRAYNIEFHNFERGLYGESNIVGAGGDVLVSTSGAIGSVAGGVVTKSIFNAVSGGITGVQGNLTKDLYFKRTMPAMLAEMEASRSNVEANIIVGLKKSDSDYPLEQAYIDLDELKQAGSLPQAIGNVTNGAVINRTTAFEHLQVVSNVNVSTCSTASESTIRAWLHPNSVLNLDRRNLLDGWLAQNKIGMTWGGFIRDCTKDDLRQQFIKKYIAT